MAPFPASPAASRWLSRTHGKPPNSAGCHLAEFNNTFRAAAEFAEGWQDYPNQMLGFNLSPSLYWGKAKQAGTLITNQQLADLGYTLQFSTLFNFRTVGLALDKGLRKFAYSGAEPGGPAALEEEEAEGAPMTKMHQKFAG
jgi:isocitrate lyase